MTIVVGLIDQGNGRVYMGADSVRSNGNRYVDRNPKIAKRPLKRPYWSAKHGQANEDAYILLGVSGSIRAGQIVHAMNVPDWPKGKTAYQYIVGPFVEAMRQALLSGGQVGKTEDQTDYAEIVVLVGIDNCLFIIWQDFSVTQPVEDYAAIGRGTDFALGSLFTTVNNPGRHRVLEALRAAAEYDDSCGAPFDWTDANGDIERVDG